MKNERNTTLQESLDMVKLSMDEGLEKAGLDKYEYACFIDHLEVALKTMHLVRGRYNSVLVQEVSFHLKYAYELFDSSEDAQIWMEKARSRRIELSPAELFH